MTDERDQQINAYWENFNTTSMNDTYVATLETEMLARYIKPDDRILDLGCGDGTGSTGYRKICANYTGFDRSSKMLGVFSQRESGMKLVRSDLRALPVSTRLTLPFTVIITQRSLINLPDAESQEIVLAQLPDILHPGGRLLLCEAFRDGAENLNALRTQFGHKPIPPRWHNVHLERSLTDRILNSHMELIAEEDLSMYFFLTRVVKQIINGDVELDWNDPFNKMAFELARSSHSPKFRGFSHISLQVWQKRQVLHL
jgi:SAM-dependent methyltransferase